MRMPMTQPSLAMAEASRRTPTPTTSAIITAEMPFQPARAGGALASSRETPFSVAEMSVSEAESVEPDWVTASA